MISWLTVPFLEQKDTPTQKTYCVIPVTGQGEGIKSFTVGGGTSHSLIQEFGGHMPCTVRLSGEQKMTNMTSVFKMRSRRAFRHYSPLNLTSLWGKLLDAAINSRASEHL